MSARTAEAPITPAVLRWARETAGHSTATAASRLGVSEERLIGWEADQGKPSLAKLREIADTYRRTPAFFFLPEPPDDLPNVPPDYRSGAGGPTPAVAAEMLKARERRQAMIDYGPDAPAFPQVHQPRPLESSARAWRSLLHVSWQDQSGSKDDYAAFRLWRDALTDLGVLIFQMSRVDVGSCRGISIYFDTYPIILLNGADAPTAKCFTLTHELRHLSHRSGGVCDLADAGVEADCNRFAAAVLMPRDIVEAQVATGVDVSQLARRFRVSREAMAIRLRALKYMSQDDLDEFLREVRWGESEASESDQSPPIPHWRTHLRNIGPHYADAMLTAYHQDRMSWSDVTHALEAKSSTVDRIQTELHRSAVG